MGWPEWRVSLMMRVESLGLTPAMELCLEGHPHGIPNYSAQENRSMANMQASRSVDNMQANRSMDTMQANRSNARAFQ